jgi:hypothetical protein
VCQAADWHAENWLRPAPNTRQRGKHLFTEFGTPRSCPRQLQSADEVGIHSACLCKWALSRCLWHRGVAGLRCAPFLGASGPQLPVLALRRRHAWLSAGAVSAALLWNMGTGFHKVCTKPYPPCDNDGLCAEPSSPAEGSWSWKEVR